MLRARTDVASCLRERAATAAFGLGADGGDLTGSGGGGQMNCEISARCFAVEPLQPINFRAFLTYIPYLEGRPHMLLYRGGHSAPVGVSAVGCPPGAGRDGSSGSLPQGTVPVPDSLRHPLQSSSQTFVHHPVQGQHH